jgi:hypothetical protein
MGTDLAQLLSHLSSTGQQLRRVLLLSEESGFDCVRNNVLRS